MASVPHQPAMKSIKLILLFASVSSGFGENIFYEKLEKLAEHCLQHGGMVDSGTMLGVYFAKGQLLSEREKPNVRNLLGKLDLIEEKYLKNHEISDENEIGKRKVDFILDEFVKKFIFQERKIFSTLRCSQKVFLFDSVRFP